jgi:integrase
MRFTQTELDKTELLEGRTERIVFDDALPGFGLRIRSGGKRTWVAQYRMGEKQRRVTLGSTKALTLDQARKAAKAALAKAQLGTDPQLEKTDARAKAAVTLASAVDRYLERSKRRLKPRSYLEVERHLRRHWSPLKETPLHVIRRADVAARLGEIASENGPFAANRARAALSALFAWSLAEGLADANPVIGTHRPAEEISRDRVLTDDELGSVWDHAGDGDFGDIIRLLILTGQRREEVGAMLHSELNLKDALWSIGGERTKNGRPHDLPLSSRAAQILEARTAREERDFVFGSGDGPFQGWSRAKSALDARLLEAEQKRNGPKAKMTAWRVHDLRRTVATRMADLGVLPHVIEAVLNHISGHKAGVAGIYNRATYAAEKRRALELWAQHVENIVQGLAPKVVAISHRRASHEHGRAG